MRGFSLLKHKPVCDRNKASIAHEECCTRRKIDQSVSFEDEIE